MNLCLDSKQLASQEIPSESPPYPVWKVRLSRGNLLESLAVLSLMEEGMEPGWCHLEEFADVSSVSAVGGSGL